LAAPLGQGRVEEAIGGNVRFSFADYTLDIDRRELWCGSTLVDVEPQVFDLLHYLVQNCDRVITKGDLVAAVWHGRIVSDSTIASRINAARKALGDNGDKQRLIRTVARKGVRFVGDVRTDPKGGGAAPAAGRAPDGSQEPARSALPPLNRPAIAVLPFVNMSGEPGQEYFSNGISEDIIIALSRLRRFFVIARNSSFSFKGKAVHLKQIAEELGVGYVVEGSVRKSGDRVRITVQLSNPATGIQLWGERYDRNLADAFAVQDEITDAIVSAIEPQVYVAENFRARKPPECLTAWGLMMRALSHFWRVTRDDNIAAQALLEKIIAINPNCAHALAVLAVSHTFGVRMGWEERKIAVPVAERAAVAAIRADDEDPWSHLAMGVVNVYLERADDAMAEYDTALRLNPSFPLAQYYCGQTLSDVGRWQEGADAARHALRLTPRDPLFALYNGVLGYAAFVGRNYDEAMRLARETICQRPDYVGSRRVFVAAAAMKGETDVAKAALRDLRRVQPNISLAWIASEFPLLQAAEREHYQEGFRRIGLE
jgi:TolB-like protein